MLQKHQPQIALHPGIIELILGAEFGMQQRGYLLAVAGFYAVLQLRNGLIQAFIRRGGAAGAKGQRD